MQKGGNGFAQELAFHLFRRTTLQREGQFFGAVRQQPVLPPELQEPGHGAVPGNSAQPALEVAGIMGVEGFPDPQPDVVETFLPVPGVLQDSADNGGAVWAVALLQFLKLCVDHGVTTFFVF